MKVIIAGGRDYAFTADDVAWLDALLEKRGPFEEVVSGGATGADAEGEKWAASHGIPVKRFPADWKTHGPAAGPIRNREMARYAEGGLCVLFPGGRGTANMRKEAYYAGMHLATKGGAS